MDKKCPKCGRNIYDTATGSFCLNCQPRKIHYRDQVPKTYGWICPVCGKGNSPFSPTCPCGDGKISWSISSLDKEKIKRELAAGARAMRPYGEKKEEVQK